MDLEIPELNEAGAHLVRIPGELDVPVSPRVLAILDTSAMQRLKKISQLGLVGQVYPGAMHSRFEHSLGVYRLACQVVIRLLRSTPAFARQVTAEEIKVFLITALVHDVGHWPYCHPIEDLRLDWIPQHETLARRLICTGQLAETISELWDVEPETVADFLAAPQDAAGYRMLRGVLDGPVDIDKMDYLGRDSLHAGVPYGRNFDVGRLISSLCVGEDNASIAITDKGKTAAEMMVFARYVMFSEVYWHHAVRSATAMLQRLVYSVADNCSPESWLEQSDAEFAQQMLAIADSQPHIRHLAEGLFGQRRGLFKRFAQFNYAENPEVHSALAQRPYSQLVRCAEILSQRLGRNLRTPLEPTDVLIDAPPVKREVQFNLSVRTKAQHRFVPLADISPVVRSLATDQFDNYVKRVRVFVAPSRLHELDLPPEKLTAELLSAAASLP